MVFSPVLAASAGWLYVHPGCALARITLNSARNTSIERNRLTAYQRRIQQIYVYQRGHDVIPSIRPPRFPSSIRCHTCFTIFRKYIQVPAIRMVCQAQLSALAVHLSIGVLIDIGESGLSVTPIFDGVPVATGVRAASCGGLDVTRFLDYMLLSRTNEQFNQMVTVCCMELNRERRNSSHCVL